MENTDYIKNMEDAERRFLDSKFEIEEKEENSVKTRKITGYAAVFDKRSQDFGGWVEVIDKRAFSDVLDDDVFALFNHDPNQVLARNKVSLNLSVDDTGLRYTFSAPNTTLGNDLLELVRTGVISKSSFAFRVKEQRWEHPEDKTKSSVRTITKVARLYDVSPVTYPAYPDSSVGTRAFKKELDKDEVNYFDKIMERKLSILQHKHNLQ